MLLSMSTPPLVLTAITFHAVSLLAGRGLSFPQAGVALSILGVAGAAGTVLSGAISDDLSTRALVTGMNAVLTIATFLLLVPTVPTSYLAFVLLGLSGGAFGVASGLVWVRS